jgi:hypothetical protein
MSVGCVHNPEFCCAQCQRMFDQMSSQGVRGLLDAREMERKRRFEELLDDVCPSRKRA